MSSSIAPTAPESNELDLDGVYACAQSRREQGAPCAFAVVAVADYASTQNAITDHGVEPFTYDVDDDVVCVFDFLELAAAARLRASHPQATAVSAGMSGDLEIAIRHGSSEVRVGTALVGERPLTSR